MFMRKDNTGHAARSFSAACSSTSLEKTFLETIKASTSKLFTMKSGPENFIMLVCDLRYLVCCDYCRQKAIYSLQVHMRLTATYQLTDINRHRDHYSRTIFGRGRTSLVGAVRPGSRLATRTGIASYPRARYRDRPQTTANARGCSRSPCRHENNPSSVPTGKHSRRILHVSHIFS